VKPSTTPLSANEKRALIRSLKRQVKQLNKEILWLESRRDAHQGQASRVPKKHACYKSS
jgi:hypothetical protein